MNIETSETLSHVAVTACPGCSVPAFEQAKRLGAAPGNQVVLSGHTFTQPDYAVFECQTCGLLFKDTILAPEILNDYYARTDFRKWGQEGFYPTERLVLRALADLPANARVLDFGCSSGRLLGRLTERCKCYGFEPNAEAACEATARGVTMLPALEADSAPASFEAIVLMDVFEHLATPTALLETLVARLAPGGRLVLATGDGDGPACRLDPARFWYFRTLEHLCMFTGRYAEFLCARTGLTLSSWQRTSHYDIGFFEQLFQQARQFAYWHTHGSRAARWEPWLRWLPWLGRAKYWTDPPYFICSKDHVVAVFRKPAF